jgi:hypothetical protein
MLTLIVAVVGGAVVIWGDPGALSFKDYATILAGFAAGHGLLGIGRGIKAGAENSAALRVPMTDGELLRDMPEEPDGDGSEANARSAPRPTRGV